MDADDQTSEQPTATPYQSLSEIDLRMAIRLAEQHLRSAAYRHHELCRAYRTEIAAMRTALAERIWRRITMGSRRPSEEQRRALYSRLNALGISAVRIRSLVHAVSQGRTTEVDALSEVEAIAVLLYLAPSR